MYRVDGECVPRLLLKTSAEEVSSGKKEGESIPRESFQWRFERVL